MASVKDIRIFKPTQQQIQQAKSWPKWSCEASTFQWHYTQTETCLILAGKVKIKDSDGQNEVGFSEGDMVIFPDGLSCTWQVDEAVEKHYKFD